MRRTKEEAARTRAAIVEGALTCFDRHGIASSTLEQIATAANVSKGAIYHHFGGKGGILREIREQVSLPLIDEADTTVLRGDGVPPLERIERFLTAILDTLEGDRRKRLALAVMQFKCEYVDDLACELQASVKSVEKLLKAFEGAYREAGARGELAAAFAPEVAALETLMFLSGLLKMWLLLDHHGPVRRNARAAIKAHIRARRAG